jgi:hypothetical protein
MNASRPSRAEMRAAEARRADVQNNVTREILIHVGKFERAVKKDDDWARAYGKTLLDVLEKPAYNDKGKRKNPAEGISKRREGDPDDLLLAGDRVEIAQNVIVSTGWTADKIRAAIQKFEK